MDVCGVSTAVEMPVCLLQGRHACRGLAVGLSLGSCASGWWWCELRSDAVDPVREAERILRGERRGRGWMIVGATVVLLALLVVAQVAPGPAQPVRAGTAVAVLRSGDSSQWCAEGVADVSGHVWSTISDRVDQVRLPLRGKLRLSLIHI